MVSCYMASVRSEMIQGRLDYKSVAFVAIENKITHIYVEAESSIL
jgi:hypothetical protein